MELYPERFLTAPDWWLSCLGWKLCVCCLSAFAVMGHELDTSSRKGRWGGPRQVLPPYMFQEMLKGVALNQLFSLKNCSGYPLPLELPLPCTHIFITLLPFLEKYCLFVYLFTFSMSTRERFRLAQHGSHATTHPQSRPARVMGRCVQEGLVPPLPTA